MTATARAGVFGRITAYAHLVRFSHTVFALPFAVMGAILAAGGVPGLATCLLILLAMVSARTTAMTMNRLADQAIDAKNPRTRDRELPSGVVRRHDAWLLLVGSGVTFVLACALLNRLALVLSPVVLVVVIVYPYLKRFTTLCHVWLGMALGISPAGAWVAVRGEFGDGFSAVVLLGGAVVFWVAGFDVIYALLDLEFDRDEGLFSLPAKLGTRAALVVSVGFHVLTVALLLVAGWRADLSVLWYGGVAVIAVLLAYEHWLVRPSEPSRLNAAFNVNAAVSVVLMVVLVADVLV
ncbi:MAG: UbiA-like polyprenyltransferase [Planctomycetota bacterium]|jgi:4-hydroxybenzoate polyprenyltransferase